MAETFFEISQQIADEFIQSILFVDDEIDFQNLELEDVKQKPVNLENDGIQAQEASPEKPENLEQTNGLHAKSIVSAFTASKKLCSINEIKKESDLEATIALAKKADITILDWKLDLETDLEEEADDDNDDVEEADHRGKYTLQLIDEIIKDQFSGYGSFKILFIYTGETILSKIAETVCDHLNAKGQTQFVIEDNKIKGDNIRIIIAGKPNLKGKFNHVPELNDWIVDYADLNEYILKCFTEMSSGLLSNFSLKSLSILRNNHLRLLNLFNKNLDAAYLGHKALLPNPDDAEELILELFKDSIGDLLQYNDVKNILNLKNIDLSLEENFAERDMYFFNNEGVNINKAYNANKELLLDLITNDNDDVEERFRAAYRKIEAFNGLSNKERDNHIKGVTKVSTTSLYDLDKTSQSNFVFARLTHHKSLFKPNSKNPNLTLGVVLRGTVNRDKYWVCIQQKCDSVRIKKDQERKFLFLPLTPLEEESLKTFHFLTPDNKKLALTKTSYEIKTIKFKNDGSEGVIVADFADAKYTFKPLYSVGHDSYNPQIDEDFEWVFDLKDLHSQRIAQEFASQLARVGLDESEWLRRWSGN
jgi:hypothetical protein